MRVFPLVTLCIALLSGCASSPDPIVDDVPPAPSTWHDEPIVTIAIIDTGINPYHPQFRDNGSLAHVHPSNYIEGFPADTPALELTLDAQDYETAVMADCDVWTNVTTDTLYWIPGTRIVGAISSSTAQIHCTQDQLPGRILDRGGHGTMTASRAAGADTGLCPACRIVAVQGFTTANMLWAATQPWIDLQSNSWGTLPTDYVLQTADRMEARQAAALHPVFVSAGNGVGGFFGATGHPIWYDGNTGPLGIIAVGAHDNGDWAVWGATMPHVVADGLANPAADHASFEIEPTGGGGTSGAAPFAAGSMARFLLEVRIAVNDTGHGVRDGRIVVPGAMVEQGGLEGPAADGLTLAEAKRIFFHTADPAVPEEPYFDGQKCPDSGSTTCALYPAVPLSWQQTGDLPKYYFVGYGGTNTKTWVQAAAVALGQASEPARPVEDAFLMLDDEARDAFDTHQP